MTNPRLTVAEVASEMREYLANVEGDYSGEGDRWHGIELSEGIEDHVAAFVLAFAARRERQVLEAAAAVLSKMADDDQLTQRGYGKSHAADMLRRLAAEVDDGE